MDEAEINTRRIDGIQRRELSDGHKFDLKFLKDSFFTAGRQKSLEVPLQSGLLPCDTFRHSPPIGIARNCYRCMSLLFTHSIRDITRTERKKISDAIIIPLPYFLPSKEKVQKVLKRNEKKISKSSNICRAKIFFLM